MWSNRLQTQNLIFILQALHEDIANHAPVFEFFLSAATALNNACSAINITDGLEPLKMLNQEVRNRWQVMTSVVNHKKDVIDSTQKQLKLYEEAVGKLTDLLYRAEATLAAQASPGADVNKAKANRDTLKVSGSLWHNNFCFWKSLDIDKTQKDFLQVPSVFLAHHGGFKT